MKQLFLSKLTTINAKNKQLSGTWHPEIANQIALQLGGSWELIAYWDKDPRLREKLGVLYDCAVIVDVNEPELIVDALRMPFIFSSKTKLLSILKLEKLSSLLAEAKKQRDGEILKWAEENNKRHSSIIQLGVCQQGTPEGKLHYQKEYGKRDGYNQALTDIKTFINKEE